MRRLNNLTRQALISCATLATVGALVHGVFGSSPAEAQAAAGTGGSGGGSAAGGSGGLEIPTCASLNFTNAVYLAGSTAVQSVINAIGPKLATATDNPITLVYTSAGSCDGVNTVVGGLKPSGSATFWDATGTSGTCTLASTAIDIGLSDVFPKSCPDITDDLLTGIGDFAGPVQSMNFAVPIAASENSISAAAAFLSIGLGETGGTDWNNPALFAFRNFQSGTETMLAKAIKLSTDKWPASADKGGAGGVLTALKTPKGAVDQTLGILASNQTDDARDTIKRLAFQGYDQACAYYPDSTYASKDKLNVRNGTYAVWGPLHMLAKATDGVPTDPKAKELIDLLTGATTVTGVDIVDLEITANTTPQCAMHVKRTTELGTPAAFTPDVSCSCYFDSKRGEADAKAACTPCSPDTADMDCPDGKKACNHGFCEVN